ncbi:MAG: VWA domain-containing protein [Dehalococcoidia bacterium]
MTGLAERRRTISGNLVNFGRVLRAAGFEVTAGRLIDAARGIRLIDPCSKEDVQIALRANLVSDRERLDLFDLLFDLYWPAWDPEEPALPLAEPIDRPTPSGGSTVGHELVAAIGRAAHSSEGDNPEATAGSADLLTVKDFATYDDRDLARARHTIRVIAPRLASAFSRRRRFSHRGDAIDLRRSLRHAARHGGEVVHLIRRRRRVRRLRLTVICDVSGSMDHYSRHLLQLLFAMQNELRGISTFVFSTRLHDVTHLLKTRSYDEALRRITRDVDAWSGGTSIGRCLAQFERTHARWRVDSRTVVVIISDGWERGDIGELQTAMAGLRRRAYRVIWLNPLLGHPGYQPVARGMAAALPYIDLFLPAHSLDALSRAMRLLGRVAAR